MHRTTNSVIKLKIKLKIIHTYIHTIHAVGFFCTLSCPFDLDLRHCEESIFLVVGERWKTFFQLLGFFFQISLGLAQTVHGLFSFLWCIHDLKLLIDLLYFYYFCGQVVIVHYLVMLTCQTLDSVSHIFNAL